MISFAVSFMAGIVVCRFYPYFPFTLSAVFVSVLIVLILKSGMKCKLAVMLSIFIGGFVYSHVRSEVVDSHKFPDRPVMLEGSVCNVPEMYGGKLRFTLKDVVVDGQNLSGRVRLVTIPEIFGTSFNETLFDPGNRISAYAKLRTPMTLRNPGVYVPDLKQSGISAIGFTNQVRFVSSYSTFASEVSMFRKKLGKIMDNSLSLESASFYKAIIPGLKGGINSELRDAFAATGLAHLLSISGTHFGLLAFVLFTASRLIVCCLPARWLNIISLYITPSQIAILLSLPVISSYLLISGMSIPALRSFLMVVIYMLALLLGRRGQWLNSLSVAACAILLVQPSLLFEISFILSFLAVLFIGLVLDWRGYSHKNDDLMLRKHGRTGLAPLPERVTETAVAGIHFLCEKVRSGFIISATAVLSTAPVVALIFKQFPLIAPASNLIVTPVVCFIMLPLGFASGIVALLLDLPILPLNETIDVVSAYTFKLIRAFSRLPLSNLYVHDPSVILLIIYYLSLLGVMIKKRTEGGSGQCKSGLAERSFFLKGVPLASLISLVFAIFLYCADAVSSDHVFRVSFLDVGQGDSTVIELPGQKTMLIDGSTGEPDMGRYVIAPFLMARGISRIDYLVVSHFHPDHYGGMLSLARMFDVGEVWVNGRLSDNAAELVNGFEKRKVPVRILRRGDVLGEDRWRAIVLHPYDEYYAASVSGEQSNENSDSLVIKMESGKFSILFTGDIEQEAEEDLLYLGEWLDSDVMKVPHHGSRTSSSMSFINAVGPSIAVISSGINNSFKHPHKEVLDRYEGAGVEVLRTDIEGAVILNMEGESIAVKTSGDYRLKRAVNLADEARNLGLLF